MKEQRRLEHAPRTTVIAPKAHSATVPHSYLFVYMIWGQEGWYADLPNYKEGEIVVPRPITKENLDLYFKALELMPAAQRHQIKEVD